LAAVSAAPAGFAPGFRLARLGVRLGFGVLLVALFIGWLTVRFFDDGLAYRHADQRTAITASVLADNGSMFQMMP
jgi:hypothetical protein